MIVLASGSPRRSSLLRSAGYSLLIAPSDVDETPLANESPEDIAVRLARKKAAKASTDHVVLAADTVVHLDGHVLDKPRDRAMARDHLTRLSGRWHKVTTGVCLRKGERYDELFETTRVRFRSLSAQEIERYLATGEADDKAGAYGIQGLAASFVAEVIGSWTNVVGLPLERCIDSLNTYGVARDAS